MLRKNLVEGDRGLYVLRDGLPNLDPGRGPVKGRGGLLDPGCMLGAEREPEPCVDELVVRRRDECVMAIPALIDPVRGGDAVEVADDLGLLDGMAGGLDPDVGAPDRVVAPDTEQIADDLTIAHRDRARGPLGLPDRLDLGSKVDVGRSSGSASRCRVHGAAEQPGGVIEMVLRKRLNLHARASAFGRYRCPMPKTLTGDELQVDDAPARDSELFLVDGNNLAYRAFFALPEELATSEGFSTNALLGFTNMLFKLLADYKPKGVAVAWDTRPVHRAAVSEDYKSERKPMPDLLREQFPYFRPIVEAFGYRNLEFEGWEADDVIATLATQADEAGIKTTVVSTDRDAFQLVSENVALMMTPRGVSDVHVYTPERVEARYGIRPEQVPDFIGLKGDTSDNIPGVPGSATRPPGS